MGVATSLVNYNSINEFALRTNLRTPRSDELISDAQHVRVRERQKERERERLCAKRKNKIKLMRRKSEENPREQRAIKPDRNLAWLLKIVPSIA